MIWQQVAFAALLVVPVAVGTGLDQLPGPDLYEVFTRSL